MKVDSNNPAEWTIKFSITGKCNLHCIYCKDAKANPKNQQTLGVDEILEILKAARVCGFKKVQWTGGECSVANLGFYARQAKSFGFTEQALTSNGLDLYPLLGELQSLGLRRANISLDSLIEENFAKITGSSRMRDVIKTIKKCSEGLELTKINVALMRMNFDEIPDFIKFASSLGSKVILKFHELWRFEPIAKYNEQHVPIDEVKDFISGMGELEELTDVVGNNPSIKYYKIKGKQLMLGFSPVPKNWTCGGSSCKKLRVYSTGRTCEGKSMLGLPFSEKVILINKIIRLRSSTVVRR